MFQFADRLRNSKDKGSIAFFTMTDNTAVWKAVDDAVRREFELEDPHAFERCINRPPMGKAMCVREYMSEFLGESVRAWNREAIAKSDRPSGQIVKDGADEEILLYRRHGKPAGWIRKHDNDEKTYFYNADEFIKELKLELVLHPDNTDFFVARDEAAIHKAVFDIVGDVCGEGNPFYLDELANDGLNAVKGCIIDYATGEMTEFTKSEDYLEAVSERLLLGQDQFAFETVTDNSAVWKELDEVANRSFGVFERDGIEASLARPKVDGLVSLGEYMRQRIWVEARSQEMGGVASEFKLEKTADENAKRMEGRRNKAKGNVGKTGTEGKFTRKPVKKHSVLARLAEKQAIVKERDRIKGTQIDKSNDKRLPVLNAR